MDINIQESFKKYLNSDISKLKDISDIFKSDFSNNKFLIKKEPFTMSRNDKIKYLAHKIFEQNMLIYASDNYKSYNIKDIKKIKKQFPHLRSNLDIKPNKAFIMTTQLNSNHPHPNKNQLKKPLVALFGVYKRINHDNFYYQILQAKINKEIYMDLNEIRIKYNNNSNLYSIEMIPGKITLN